MYPGLAVALATWYNDGITKVFLYTGGTTGGSDSLKNLLTFMETSDRHHAVDEELSQIMDIVDTVKCSKEEKNRYMGILSVMDYEKRDAYLEGEARGEARGVIRTCKDFCADRNTTKEKIMKQFALKEDQAEEYLTLYWDQEPEENH